MKTYDSTFLFSCHLRGHVFFGVYNRHKNRSRPLLDKFFADNYLYFNPFAIMNKNITVTIVSSKGMFTCPITVEQKSRLLRRRGWNLEDLFPIGIHTPSGMSHGEIIDLIFDK